MQLRGQGFWSRFVGVALAAALLTPLGAPSAAAGSGTQDVAFDPSSPDRVRLDLSWDPRTGDTITAPRDVDLLRLVLPTGIQVLDPQDMTYIVRGATTFDDWRYWGVTAREPVVDGVIAFDLVAATEKIKGTRLDNPTQIMVNVIAGDPDVFGEGGSMRLTIWISLVEGSASVEQEIRLAHPQDPGAAEQELRWVTAPTVAGFGSTLVVHASEGFWPGPAHVEVVTENGNYQHHTGRASPDGRRLTFRVPERWWPTVGDLREVIVRPHFPASSDAVTIPIVQASADPVAAYVTSVYSDLFGRSPDPSGLATWTGALRGGTPYGAVADGITYSPEFRSGLIADAYEYYLLRTPEPAGLRHWLAQMEAGMHIQDLEANMIASPEYYLGAGGTDAAWVTALYADVLDRAPSASEVAGWVAVARTSGRMAVARGFLFSTEELTTVVEGYYHWLLRRDIDSSGRRTWVEAIQAGARNEAIIAGIIASPEYRNRVPVSS